MSKPYEPALPVMGTKVPTGPDWMHEIKYDGYRLIVVRENDRVRLLTRNGYDWAKRFPFIVEAALKNRQTHFVIDGEAVVLTMTGLPDFDALHSRRHDDEVQLYAFDILAGDGDDYRSLPLKLRKPHLARLLARRPEGIFAAPYEQGEIGPELFRQACLHGLEGMVSKHRDRAYRAGRCDHWIKVKNRQHPAFNRVLDQVSTPKKYPPRRMAQGARQLPGGRTI
ncbi:bifunctional non-homologous end joining protein LigD [Bradyrhizobium diazoefficiens]|nr:DNA ligase [Bradyrhizobium diazoefficiens]BCF70730.1 DNA ligase [Bradyrhizobium diazoefficiens]